MLQRLLVACLIFGPIQAAGAGAPADLYVVSASFSDGVPGFSYRIIEVKPQGPNSLIRYTRITSVSPYCPRMIVQSLDRVVREPLAKIIGSNNPCAIQPKAIQPKALRNYTRTVGLFGATSFGVVASCASSPMVLALPAAESMDFNRLRRERPQVGHLWDLAASIVDPVFGARDVFLDPKGADDLSLQDAGERIVPDLISGRYDDGLAAALQGNVGASKALRFRDVLASYRGPVTADEIKQKTVGQLRDAQAYHFTRYVAPKYPPLALSGRVQGQVELRLTVAPATGDVLSAEAVSGHVLLQAAAIDAAKQWQFQPDPAGAREWKLTVDFDSGCR